jgi:outer membrane protein assembly factor BamB
VIPSDETIYVITFEDLLYALTSDGAEKWRFQLPKAVNGEQHAAQSFKEMAPSICLSGRG